MTMPYVPGLPHLDRTLVMGVVNVTPDSFSDGGMWFEPNGAIRHGLDLLEEGADIIDVGGESTRPGAERPEMAEELRRVLPVVSALADDGAIVSVDTMRCPVAVQAVEAGARMINDVSGGGADSAMLPAVAALGVPYVCMHWRGQSVDMQRRAVYADVVADVIAELRVALDRCLGAGIARDRLIADPGFGFAKTGEHNWQLLRRMTALDELGLPILAAVSRKTFLGTLLADANGNRRPPRERDDASLALVTLLATQRVWGVRVHAVRSTRAAIAVVQRLGAPPSPSPGD